MISRILSVLLSAAILLTATLPAHAAPPAQGQSQASLSSGETPPFALQGEIVYVVDGNLVLHDLATGATRQLTDDGLAMLPAWSPDGRYVTYSSGYDLDSSDLYILDIGTGESRLLAEDACADMGARRRAHHLPGSWRRRNVPRRDRRRRRRSRHVLSTVQYRPPHLSGRATALDYELRRCHNHPSRGH